MITTRPNSPCFALPASTVTRHSRFEAPRFCGPLDLLLEDISRGHAEFSTASPVPGPGGLVGDTGLSTLLDLALGAAVQSVLPLGRGYRVIGLQVFAVPGSRSSGDLTRAVADVVRAGGRVVTVRGRLLDARGALMARASLVALVDHDVVLAPPA